MVNDQVDLDHKNDVTIPISKIEIDYVHSTETQNSKRRIVHEVSDETILIPEERTIS